MGGSTHHVQNNQDFLQSIEGIQLKPDEEMMSFDVESLFTSVPVDPSIDIIKKLLEERQNSTPKNQHDSRSDHLSSKVLFNNHLFHFPGEDI